MNDLSLTRSDQNISVITPVIPLELIYPGFSAAQIFSIVWAHRKSTLLIIFLGLSLLALAMFFWPRTYTATATLMVNYEVNDPANGKELPMGQVGSYIATQVELMQTPSVLLTVVDRLDLTQNSDYATGYRSGRGTLREWAAAKVSKTLAVYPSQRGSQLIYVTYSASNATEAALVANTVVDVYKEQDEMRSTGPPGERMKRYALQLDELKAKVDQAQINVTAFYQRNALITEGNKSNVDLDLLTSLEGRWVDAQNARHLLQARVAGDQSVSDQVLSSGQAQTLKTQLAAQEIQLARLNRIYTPEHPEVQESKLQLEATRGWLASTVKNYADNASAGLGAAQRLEQNLQTAVAAQRAKILANSRLQDSAAKYLLELESAQTVYKRSLEGYDPIKFFAAGHYINVNLVSRASPPIKASKPSIGTSLILGVILAIGLGFAIPLIYELFNRRVRCRDDIERQYGIPVLVEFGQLPKRMMT
jgi:uncharacterized protein involved in exopolysaccharide biosynthesis